MMAKIPPPARKGDPPAMQETLGNLDTPRAGILVPLNFKVPDAFRREYKIFAAQHRMNMVDALLESFELLKRERTK